MLCWFLLMRYTCLHYDDDDDYYCCCCCCCYYYQSLNSCCTRRHYTWLLTSAKIWCPCGRDALVNTSVFCADLRLVLGGKTVAGLSAASQKQWDMRPPELYFYQIKVLMGVGTIRVFFIISIGLWPETNRNVHHWTNLSQILSGK